jgi:hypothetical protein
VLRLFGIVSERRIGIVISGFVKRLGGGLTLAAGLAAAVALSVPSPAQARIDTGAAVGIGLGSFALGSALGAASRPYYPYGGYPYGYYAPPAPVYYPPPAPAYYAPRSCWDPYGARYYAC